MKRNVLTRREFLKDSATFAVTGSLLLNLPRSVYAQEEVRSRVVLIRRQNLLDENQKVRKEVVLDMLDEAVVTLTGAASVLQAWQSIVRPDDIVGIKSNVWHYLPTPPELENALKTRVLEAGVSENHLAVADRGILSHKVFQKATALINVRPMRTHYWSGVGSLLKNYIMFVERPSDYHGDTCADLATIWKLPLVAGKTRLNILVLFTPLFHSVGPHAFNSQYTWTYQGMLVGFDPVAVDATGVRIIIAKRRDYFKEDRPLNPPAKHIFLADTRHQLGTADPGKIELIKLGWQEGILI